MGQDLSLQGVHRLEIDPRARLSLRDHVRAALRMAIVSGRVRSGERMNERALAGELGVSTTPVKEALRQLEAEGLLEILPRKGLVVRFDGQMAEEMILARAALESPIAALAAQRIDAAGKLDLQGTIRLMEEATRAGDVQQLIVLNETFHRAIHLQARSVHLVHLVARQQFYDDDIRRVIHRDRGESAAALREHAAICSAIVSGDAGGARNAMSEHVLRSGQVYLDHVFRGKNDSDVQPA